MSKPFKKRVGDFLRLKQTKDFIVALETRYADSLNVDNQILRVVQGGLNPELQGTWMNEKLALKFAAWLSPDFELWIYDRIHELMTTGKTQLPQIQSGNIVRSLRMIADWMEGQEIFNNEIRQDVDFLAERMGEIEAKITSIDESHYTISGYCSLKGIAAPQSKANTWGRAASKLSRDKGYEIGKAYDAKLGEINTYHVDILSQIIE